MTDFFKEISSLESERAVLGSILMDAAALPVAMTILSPDDFYAEANRIIMRTIVGLSDKGQPADIMLMAEELKKQGTLEKAGGFVYLSDLRDNTPSSINISHYSRSVKEKAVMRQLVESARDIIVTVQEKPELGAEELVAYAQKRIIEISAVNAAGRPMKDAKDAMREAFTELERRHKEGRRLPGIPSGFDVLDSTYTGGLRKGGLYIVAGRPGTGKSALALNIARTVAGSGELVAFFSLEMPTDELSFRLLSSESGIDGRRISHALLIEADWPRLVHAADKIGKAAMTFDDTGGISIDRLAAKARRLKIEKGLGLIIVDYLQLVRASQKWHSREAEVAEVSRSLKALAKELQVPVMAAAQLNRAVESRADKKPTLSDLRESGAIEQDADVIMFLSRPEDNAPMELDVAKNRQGPIGKVELEFNASTTKFRELGAGTMKAQEEGRA